MERCPKPRRAIALGSWGFQAVENATDEVVVPACFLEFHGKGCFWGIALDHVEGPAAQDGDAGRAVILAVARRILTEGDIELPVQVRAAPEVAILSEGKASRPSIG